MILFDFQIFLNQRYGGISLLFAEIMEELNKKNLEFEIPVLSTNNENLMQRSYFNPVSSFPFPKDISGIDSWFWGLTFSGKSLIYLIFKYFKSLYIKIAFRIIYYLNKRLTINKVAAGKVKIFHPTYYDNYFINILENEKRIRKVITIYDLIHERFPGYYKLSDIALQNRKAICEFSDKIISISESTKHDLIEFYNIPKEKIEVIHLGTNIAQASDIESKFIWKDYILFVGERGGYKNFENFIKGIAPIVFHYKIHIVLLGGGKLTNSEIDLLRKFNILGKTIQLNFSSNSELKYIYRNASMFIFPSLYEGFGIPLVDAMSLGCPVLCSNTSSFPEVVGDAGILFDPWFSDSITEAVEKLMNSESLKRDLIKKGIKRSKNFTWEKCANKHVELYRKLLVE